MRKILCLVFLVTFVQSHQDVQEKGNILPRPPNVPDEVTPQSTLNALNNLMKTGVPIKLMWSPMRLLLNHELGQPVSKACLADMRQHRYGDENTGIYYDFQRTCYLIGRKVDRLLSMKSTSDNSVPAGSQRCAKLPQLHAVFLPFEPNKNTYMILKPDIAPWFFTSELSGCDIFIATSPTAGEHPIIIHANLNKYGDEFIKTLLVKGKTVDQMLMSRPGYRLVARVYCEVPSKVKADAMHYFRSYKGEHPHLKLFRYGEFQYYHFLGHFGGNRWQFILKGDDGTTTPLNL